MKIIIASLGRAHLLDSARELQAQGHDVRFICATHRDTFVKYGLKKGGINLIYYVAVFYFIKKLVRKSWSMKMYRFVLDLTGLCFMRRCDVFICQSPNYQLCMKYAKKKGAKTILDRGSSHVRLFDELMLKYEGKAQSESYIQYDERQYNLADYITVASDFVESGFLKFGIDSSRLFINPYGVSEKYFMPTICTEEYDCIFVGAWSLRKGCNLITEAFTDTSIRILHVGSIGNVDFPDLPNFKHVDPVSETELRNYYAKAKVFLFPSQEDGFGLVLCQAIFCGLPIVCSKNCGGPTLVRLLGDDSHITVLDDLSPNTIYSTVNETLKKCGAGLRNYSEHKRKDLSWEAYGKRYDEFLHTIVDKK